MVGFVGKTMSFETEKKVNAPAPQQGRVSSACELDVLARLVSINIHSRLAWLESLARSFLAP